MGVMDRLRGRRSSALALREAGDLVPVLEGQVVPTAEVLAEQLSIGYVREAMADLELAMEDAGWKRMTAETEVELSRDGLRTSAQINRALIVANALLNRGVTLRIGYVWGSGVTTLALANGKSEDNASEQDVNTVVQDFLEDPANQRAVFGEQASEQIEQALASDGNVFAALFTGLRTGKVQVRLVPFDEIEDVIFNPEDRSEPWYYVRQFQRSQPDPTQLGKIVTVTVRELHPDVDYRPATRVKAATVAGWGTMAIRWDAPIHHLSVNKRAHASFGIPDVFAAVAWSRAYAEFLGDWRSLVKALSKFAWKRTPGKGSRASQIAAKAVAAAKLDRVAQGAPVPAADRGEGLRGGDATGLRSDAGAAVTISPDATLEAIPKTGATIDAESGRPLAAMAAAALQVPVTMLVADPGVTGARAVAETLDKPTELAMGMRRTRHGEFRARLCRYQIAESVRAPGGALRGVITRDEFGREVVTLAGDTDQSVQTTWPPLESDDVFERMQSINLAANLPHPPPPLAIVRLALETLKVEDIDDLLESMTDDDGNLVDPAVSAGAQAIRAHFAGDDPATAV